MDDAISVVEYKVKNLKKELNIDNVSDKIKFLNAITLISIQNNCSRFSSSLADPVSKISCRNSTIEDVVLLAMRFLL